MFVVGVIAFCGFSTNAMFALHTSYLCRHNSDRGHDSPAPQRHDSSKCPICMAIQGHSGKFIASPVLEHTGTVVFNPDISFEQNISPPGTQREPFTPRGPPLFAYR